MIWRGRTSSYRDLDALIRRWHGAIAARGPARIAVRGENQPKMVALIHAAARAGVPLALLNARLTAAEIAPLLDRLEPALRLGDLSGGIPLEAFAADALPAEPRAIDPSAVHTLLFTSGTTGRPKGAQLTVGSHQASARASIEALRIDGRCSYLCNLPLFHVGGLATLVRCAMAGAALVLHERFDARASADALASGITHASLVATTLRRVLDVHSAFPETVRAVLVGGGAAPAGLLERARSAGLPVLLTYGLTEAASQVTAERIGDADGATSGWPLPGTEVRIAEGQIEVRGPTMMRGYLGEPPLTGWFATGDLGTLDARGRLIVHARRADLIVSGGENVYPAEVEAALLAHPDVLECAVLPWPDGELGQVGRAAVVARRALDGAELREHCRARLAAFKVPRRFVLLGALPRNAAGKVDRESLARALQTGA